MLKVSDVAQQLGVTPHTIRQYTNQGKLQSHRTPGNQRYFTQDQIDKFLGKPTPTEPKQIKAYYIRSSNGNKTLLDSQLKLLTQEYGKPEYIFKDNASGLNDNRPGLKQALDKAEKGLITHLYVTNPDRLTRFNTKYLTRLFNAYNVEVITHSKTNPQNLQEELLQDFMMLLASFSGKYYRIRGIQQKQNLLNLAQTQLHQK